MDMIESQSRKDAPGKAALTKPPTPLPALPLQPKPTDLKRKRVPKGKEVMEAGKTHSSQEDKAQRAAKQAKVGQKGTERRSDPQVKPSSWLPAPMLDGALLLADTSIRDF